MKKSEANGFAVTLEVGDKKNLFILLDSGGTVNRQGNGRSDSDTDELYLGATGEPLFERLMSGVPEDLFRQAGSYHDPAPKGLPCKLSVVFQSSAEAAVFEYEYGSESPGPPAEISRLVVRAIELTDPYYVKRDSAGVIGKAKDALRRLWR
jgi:hypothetical protein